MQSITNTITSRLHKWSDGTSTRSAWQQRPVYIQISISCWDVKKTHSTKESPMMNPIKRSERETRNHLFDFLHTHVLFTHIRFRIHLYYGCLLFKFGFRSSPLLVSECCVWGHLIVSTTHMTAFIDNKNQFNSCLTLWMCDFVWIHVFVVKLLLLVVLLLLLLYYYYLHSYDYQQRHECYHYYFPFLLHHQRFHTPSNARYGSMYVTESVPRIL